MEFEILWQSHTQQGVSLDPLKLNCPWTWGMICAELTAAPWNLWAEKSCLLFRPLKQQGGRHDHPLVMGTAYIQGTVLSKWFDKFPAHLANCISLLSFFFHFWDLAGESVSSALRLECALDKNTWLSPAALGELEGLVADLGVLKGVTSNNERELHFCFWILLGRAVPSFYWLWQEADGTRTLGH